MRVHRSNRVEVLLELLAAILRRPLSDPMAPEHLVIQSRGLQQWLSRELGEQLGICANITFPFPRAFLEDCMERVLGTPPEAAASWQPSALQWAVTRCLEEDLDGPIFAPIHTYLKTDPSDLRRIQLAALIADRFDQYGTYRPDHVQAWEDPGTPLAEDDWQGALWRKLVDRVGAGHLAARASAYLQKLPSTHSDVFPERVCLFGIPSLPPLYMDLLRATAEKTELHLFLLEPSPLYAGDTRSPRAIARIEALGEHTAEDLHLETGHPLAASLGWVSRSFQSVLEKHPYTSDPEPLFQESEEESLLGLLQNDLMHQTDRRSGGDAEPVPLKDGDRSLSFHSCHSPMREVEALRDHLQAWLDEDTTRCPEDIVVMAPDIGTYAASIATVFGHDRGKAHHIPYQVADRSLQSEGEVVDAFLAWLDLADSRLTAPDVIDLLSRPCVARAVGLEDTHIDTVARWVRELHIHWGRDAAHRDQEEQPGRGEHTWSHGLDRMLLGIAMAPGTVVRGILPYEEMEGDAVQPLASLVSFMHTLWEVQDACRASMTPEEWSTLFLHVLDTGIQAEASQNWQEDSLRAVVRELDRSSTHGAYDSPLSHGAVRWWVRARLDRERSSRRFASGGVTFCSMLPMRTVPFTFIGMLGLNQETYPRQDHLPAFDLIHTQTRPGDRTRRDDDRHLFLESLMSARQVIRISWVGRSIRDNNETPPSVVVAELLDWLGAACTPEHGEGSSTPQTLTRMHPLQPFSPLRFCTPSIDRGSHDPVYALAAKAMLGDQEVEPRFMESILPLPEHAQLEIPLHTLLRCVENPSRTLLQDRLGLQLQRWEDTLKEREALAPDSLDLYPLRAAVLDLLVQGLDPEGAWAQLKPTGLFPGGPVGRCLFDGLMAEMDELIEVVRPWHEGERVPQQEVDLNVPTKRGPTRVYGSLTDLRPNAQLLLIPAKLKEKYRLRAWVRHLVLCALEGDDLPRTTVIAGVNPKPGKNEPRYKIVEFMEVEDPLPLLGRLVGMYWWSMQEPVAFFPEVSWPASDPDFQRDLNLDEQVRESRKNFRPLIVPAGLAPKRGARPDPWVRRIYARLDPFQTPSPYSCSFRGITRVVYDDMRAHTVREP